MPHSPDEPLPAGYELRWPGKRARPPGGAATLRHLEAHDGPRAPASLFDSRADDFRNRLIRGDNLPVMEALLPELRGCVDLVYLDPPFQAGQEFVAEVPVGEANGRGPARALSARVPAFQDTWEDGAYLQMLYERLPLVRELLAETGSVVVHVNWQVAHLVRALLDEVFGPGERSGAGRPGFRNEIIWGYGGGGAVKNAYRRKHDNLFWYTRSSRWTFNPQFRPYTEKTRQRGLTAVKGDRYELREEGAALETWWTGPEIQKILSPTAYENLKYPTQKPEALLERIIRGHSNPAELVADFFRGSVTTGAVAERLGRRWIMADSSRLAVHVARRRLLEAQRAPVRAEPYRAFDLYACGESSPAAGDEILAKPVFHSDGSVDIRLTGFRAAPDDERLRALSESDPLALVDYWAVDFTYDASSGRPFQPQWHSYRAPRDRRLSSLSAARHRYRGGGTHLATAQAVDVYGRTYFTPVVVDSRIRP